MATIMFSGPVAAQESDDRGDMPNQQAVGVGVVPDVSHFGPTEIFIRPAVSFMLEVHCPLVSASTIEVHCDVHLTAPARPSSPTFDSGLAMGLLLGKRLVYLGKSRHSIRGSAKSTYGGGASAVVLWRL